jgi:hypothetical protein
MDDHLLLLGWTPAVICPFIKKIPGSMQAKSFFNSRMGNDLPQKTPDNHSEIDLKFD